MINIDYVNDSIDLETEAIFQPFNTFMETCKKDIDNMLIDFNVVEEKVTLESYIMGSVPDSMMMVYESEKKNIFTKIGEMIIELGKKFAEFIDNIIDKLKTLSFNRKADLQKLDIIIKKHPELKKDETIEIEEAFYKGALNLNDVKSLKELDKSVDEIVRLAKQKDIDPKTLKGKWEKAKKTFEEKSEKMEKSTKGVMATIGLVIAIRTFGPSIAKAVNDLTRAKQETAETDGAILNIIRANADQTGVDDNTGICTLLLQIKRYRNQKYAEATRDYCGVFNRLSTWLAGIVDRFIDHDGNIGRRKQFNLNAADNIRRDREYTRERDRAAAQAEGRN